MDTHITSGGHIQTLDKVIHYLAEFFQYAVHYIFANFKMMSNTCKKTEIFLQKFGCLGDPSTHKPTTRHFNPN